MTYHASFQTVEAASIQAGQQNPLPEESHFVCLPECGLCCSYRVLLSPSDVHRLLPTTKNTQVWQTMGGETALERSADFCVLLSADRRCSSYDHRPDQCRAFPYMWTIYEKPELDVDLSCPGVGQGEITTFPQFEETVRSEPNPSQILMGIKHLQDFLRAQGRYASPAIRVATGAWAIETWRHLSAHNPNVGFKLNASLPPPNAIHDPDLDSMKQHHTFQTLALEKRLDDRNWIERHFATPRLNTRFNVNHDIELYRFWIEGQHLHLEPHNGTHINVQLKTIQTLEWRSEARATRFAYLHRWLKRQLPVRLANTLAMSAPVHTASCYLEFLLDIDWRISLLSVALAIAADREEVDHDTVLEAIRGSDGLMRAWCESARFTVNASND